jgi:hypothetical protein
MYRKFFLCLCVVLFSVVMATAQDADSNKESEAKELSGMSIVGNDEAPKSLYIVPWKSSEIGAETTGQHREITWLPCLGGKLWESIQ